MIQNITVFTDASYCHHTNAAGGAVWARGDGSLRFQSSFQLEGVHSSNDAEVLTACHAIQGVWNDEGIGAELRKGPNTRLVLVVDCMGVKHALESGRTEQFRSNEVGHAVRVVMELQRQARFWLKINHVPGHGNGKTARSWVNNWCDEQARNQMLALRAQMRGE